MNALTVASMLGAGLGAGAFGACFAIAQIRRNQRERLRSAARQASSIGSPERLFARGLAGFGLAYARRLTRRLFAGSTKPLSPSVRAQRARATRAGSAFADASAAAGCDKDVSVAAFCEARTRLCFGGLAIGLIAGLLLSTELGLALGVVGGLAGARLPMWSVNWARRIRAAEAEEHLSEMLEVVSLGLRSGLTFDRSFELYGSHFDSEFANACAATQIRWSLGLATREEALRGLAASFDCEQLSRVVETSVRNLRLGTSLIASLDDAAVQSRAAWKAQLEEKVAKAPVKMMLPTGTLILPAMLLLVMGPILLELANGF